MKNITLLMASLVLSACAQISHSDLNEKTFVAKPAASTPLDMNKWKEKRSGLLPARNGDVISAKFFNTFPVPITISRIEFPKTENSTCTIKSNTHIVVPPYSITDIDLINISILAGCYPDLVINKGAKFIGVPNDSDYAESTRTTGVMLQFDEKIYKTSSTSTMSYPLVFDTRGMYQ
ncbi:hypothetical protein GL273_20705 [Aeromonas jandaei]|uniref:hypothetical protein n=1 Tax=Aeromonas jandaei TaxID=650 RepID=UPI001C5B0DD6|nr:hypothetical protein [Aeromonas jandaei]MBW3808181.1 hypothetical protein [Aeromonas jandaei]